MCSYKPWKTRTTCIGNRLSFFETFQRQTPSTLKFDQIKVKMGAVQKLHSRYESNAFIACFTLQIVYFFFESFFPSFLESFFSPPFLSPFFFPIVACVCFLYEINVLEPAFKALSEFKAR